MATDGRIPRPLRWLAAAGLLPVPGPVDEAILLVVAALLGLFYRDLLRVDLPLGATGRLRTGGDGGQLPRPPTKPGSDPFGDN